MKENKLVMTSEELKEGLSKRLRSLDDENPDCTAAKVYFTGAGKLISTFKFESDVAERLRMGTQITQSTKDFLGLN